MWRSPATSSVGYRLYGTTNRLSGQAETGTAPGRGRKARPRHWPGALSVMVVLLSIATGVVFCASTPERRLREPLTSHFARHRQKDWRIALTIQAVSP
jgi:hypothetical protein